MSLVLYCSTFITVFALGFQSQNVNGGHYWAAFLTSFAIGGASLVLYKVLPDATTAQCAAYLLGGATGIVASMWAHRRWMKKPTDQGPFMSPAEEEAVFGKYRPGRVMGHPGPELNLPTRRPTSRLFPLVRPRPVRTDDVH
jgi:hypothetical protein